MAQVSLRNIVKTFDNTQAVCGIDLDIADKEFVVLVGPIRVRQVDDAAHDCRPRRNITGGEMFRGRRRGSSMMCSPKDRDMAMVFQNYALYPHMSVFENMSFGLRLKRFPKDEIQRRVNEAARILDLTELLDRKPRQLSGGQRAIR